jgi:RecB family exonuclease
LAELVRNAVELALARWRGRRASVFQQRFFELERRRLEELLLEWLTLERERAPFEVVAIETARRLEVGGVQLELRLDRIDRLEDGGELLLDYKTGSAPVSRWFDSRPDEPQLPLYTLTAGAAPAGLAFARVARGECGFSGLAARDGIGPGIEPFAPARGRAQDWAGQLEAWRQTLSALGEQFRAGVVTVDPKRYPITCDSCSLRTLCRVEELVERTPEGATDEEP